MAFLICLSSIYLSINLYLSSINLSMYLSVSITYLSSIRLSIYLSSMYLSISIIYLSVYIYHLLSISSISIISISMYLFITYLYVSLSSSMYLSTYLSFIYLYICLPIIYIYLPSIYLYLSSIVYLLINLSTCHFFNSIIFKTVDTLLLNTSLLACGLTGSWFSFVLSFLSQARLWLTVSTPLFSAGAPFFPLISCALLE